MSGDIKYRPIKPTVEADDWLLVQPQRAGTNEEYRVKASDIVTFTPSIFSGAKTATTTVDDQAELFAEGATRLDISHMNTTNDLIIGFGSTLAEAKAACSSGTAGVDKFLLLRTGLAGIPVTLRQFRGDYAAYAWLGVGGTVECLITQGVRYEQRLVFRPSGQRNKWQWF